MGTLFLGGGSWLALAVPPEAIAASFRNDQPHFSICSVEKLDTP